jgi:hypothetical protein
VRVKIRPTMNIIGLDVGREAEIEFDEHVAALIRAGYLKLLRPINGQDVPE